MYYFNNHSLSTKVQEKNTSLKEMKVSVDHHLILL